MSARPVLSSFASTSTRSSMIPAAPRSFPASAAVISGAVADPAAWTAAVSSPVTGKTPKARVAASRSSAAREISIFRVFSPIWYQPDASACRIWVSSVSESRVQRRLSIFPDRRASASMGSVVAWSCVNLVNDAASVYSAARVSRKRSPCPGCGPGRKTVRKIRASMGLAGQNLPPADQMTPHRPDGPYPGPGAKNRQEKAVTDPLIRKYPYGLPSRFTCPCAMVSIFSARFIVISRLPFSKVLFHFQVAVPLISSCTDGLFTDPFPVIVRSTVPAEIRACFLISVIPRARCAAASMKRSIFQRW